MTPWVTLGQPIILSQSVGLDNFVRLYHSVKLWNLIVISVCQAISLFLSLSLGVVYGQPFNSKKSILTTYYLSGIESQNRPSLASLVVVPTSVFDFIRKEYCRLIIFRRLSMLRFPCYFTLTLSKGIPGERVRKGDIALPQLIQ